MKLVLLHGTRRWNGAGSNDAKMRTEITKSILGLLIDLHVEVRSTDAEALTHTSACPFHLSNVDCENRGLFILRLDITSLHTLGVAVAVKPRIGTPGNTARILATFRYAGLEATCYVRALVEATNRKSWPHVDTQCTSSTAIRIA
jgi:hypothetical protein